MVLSGARSIEVAKTIIDNPYNYMVLETNRLKYGGQKEKFKSALEVLNFVDLADTINKTIEKLESPQRIKTDIFYTAIECIIENLGFHDAQFKQYLIELDKVYSYSQIFQNLAETDYYMPFEVDYILLGMTPEELNNLSQDKLNEFSESYGDIWEEHNEKKITVDQYIGRAKLLIEGVRRNKAGRNSVKTT
ncbi:hypothetical protein [Maribacter sp. Hel_I_7]|uniref:hypothetical protein n=1 Tax=Maribacter sp. Hel_I_7 TaxID=1249997 RepID=UPI00047E7F68|nr:hypothetical protein [Maribacter sp. Hel_I_7]